MTMVYVLTYIHSDNTEYNEVLGVFRTKDKTVCELLERANYREKNGILTQYLEPTQEYPSFKFLKEKVETEMELHDEDIYRITIHQLE